MKYSIFFAPCFLIKSIAIAFVLSILITNISLAQNTPSKTDNINESKRTASENKNRLIEELRPRQISEFVSKSSMVFIPVSPVFEWHSYHLPLATDALIAEEVSKIFANHFDGVYFRTLSVSLEEWRDTAFLKMFGVPDTTKMYGMDFPGLPVRGEYHHSGPPFMRQAVEARLMAVKNSGFKYAYLLNCHGGKGQKETLKSIAEEWTSANFKVFSISSNSFNKYQPEKKYELYLKEGGHAGIKETHFLMAFRPDLVDLTEIPAGDLKASEYGIYNKKPIIADSISARHALQSIANEVRKSILENGIKYIESTLKK